ncbi:MAG: carboxypeptidase-like regulatory domain-containing protein, partial [Dehalococcoidia bacterium]
MGRFDALRRLIRWPGWRWLLLVAIVLTPPLLERSTASSQGFDPLAINWDGPLNPPGWIAHNIWRSTTSGPVKYDIWGLYRSQPFACDGGPYCLVLADGSGGTQNYGFDQFFGPYGTPRAVCEGARSNNLLDKFSSFDGPGGFYNCRTLFPTPTIEGCDQFLSGDVRRTNAACTFITGKVKVLQTLAPISGAVITATTTSGSKYAATSASDGSFSLTVPVGTGYRLDSTARGYHLYGSPPVVSAPSKDHSLLLDPDLSVVGIEVTQLVQNLRNDVPLYADKPTFVRVHFKNDGAAAFANVTGVLTPTRGGALIDGKTLTPIAKASIATGAAVRGSPGSAVLFELPSSALNGTISLHFGSIADGGGALPHLCDDPGLSGGECKVTVTFAPSPKLAVKLLAVESYDANGALAVPTSADLYAAAVQLRTIMPIANLDWTQGSYKSWLTPNLSGFGTPYRWARLLLMLDKYAALDLCGSIFRVGCNRYYIGILSGAWDDTTGQASFVTDTALAYLASGLTVSHETGHLAGRSHVLCSFGRASFGNTIFFPDKDGTIGVSTLDDGVYYGFNPINQQVLGPTTCDLMGYGSPRWPSKYTYTGIAGRLAAKFGTASLAPLAEQDAILVSGIITASTGAAVLDPFYTTRLTLPTQPVSGTYQLRFEDAAGAVLSTAYVTNDPPSEDPTGDVQPFIALAPWNPATRRVSLLRGDTVLASRAASPGGPTVGGLSPNGGETWSGAAAEVKWTQTGAGLASTVQLSRDGGATWETLAIDLAGSSYPVDLSRLGGSSQALVRVLTSDGFTTASVQSAKPFTITNQPPLVGIDTPTAGALVWGNQPVNFRGEASDPQAGMLDGAAVTWRSSRDGVLGTGTSLSRNASTLTTGIHVITMSATSPFNLTAAATTTISVSVAAPVRPAVPRVGPSEIALAVARGRSEVVPLQVYNAGDGNFTATLSVNQPWLKLARSSVEAGGVVTVTVDAVALALGLHQDGTVTVQVAGVAPIVVPVSVLVETAPAIYLPNGFMRMAQSGPPDPVATATPTLTPPPGATATPTATPTTPGSAGINGRLTRGGSPAPAVPLSLILINGGTTSTRATTTTGSDGRYAFSGAPGLSAGQSYYVA